MLKKIDDYSAYISTAEIVKKHKKAPEALPQVEVAENTDSEILQLKQRMMEELKHKGLDMDAIERILHIRDLV